MKRIRILSITVGTALAVLAIVGAAQALANQTTLCSTNASPCPEANIYPSGTSLSASSSEKFRIDTNVGTVSCTETALSGKSSAKSGKPLPAEISTWSIGACKLGATTCKKNTTANLPYSASLTYGSGGGGKATLTGSGGKVGWSVTCGSFIDCTMSFEPTLSVAGGNPAQLKAVEQAMQGSGSNCPKSVTFKPITYTVSAPQPLYLEPLEVETLKGTTLCGENVGGGHCPEGMVYPASTVLKGALASGTKAELRTGTGNYECSSSAFSGETTAEAGEPLPASIKSFSLESCQLGGSSCSATFEETPYSANFSWSGSEALLKVNGWKFHFVCGASINCRYTAPEYLRFVVTGGSPASVKVSEGLEYETAGGLCPSSPATFVATYQINSPNPLYPALN